MTHPIKFIRDGKSAILYSPGYGAGWSTWNKPEMAWDSRLILAYEAGELREVTNRLYPEAYLGGYRNIVLNWLPVGTKYRITEYDGSETLEEMDKIDWLEA